MGKVVFITGISSGFGKHTSVYLARNGYTVYGSCRGECKTDPAVKVLCMDITDREAVEKGIGFILEKEGKIDILINNAGMHTGGPAEVISNEDIRLQMETNFMGAIHTIRTVLPLMRIQRSGIIMNISSIGGLMGLPFQGYYSAAKFALEGISEALRMELRPFNIKVIVINPGDFHTHNTINRKNTTGTDDIKDYVTQFRKTLAVIEKDENGGWHPEILARKIYRILKRKNPRNRYIIASFEQRVAVLLKKILPSGWFDAILRSHYGIR